MVLDSKLEVSPEEVERRDEASATLTALSVRAAALWVSPPSIKAELCANHTTVNSPVSTVTTTDTDSESDEHDLEKNEAASILSSVVKPCSPVIGATTKSPASSSSTSTSDYEDLLDCLASLASGRAPMEPVDKGVARMSVDDINVRTGCSTSITTMSSSSSSSSNVEASAMVVDETPVVDRPPARRPRAVSNPEGCEVWRRIEMAARKQTRSRQVPGGAASSSSSAVPTPTLPHMLAKYASIYNKGGRIGIYTRDERDAIIRRFREKKARRVWAKKIRYTCRKSLADKRIRIKGRFVKLEDMEAILQQQEKGEATNP